MIDDRLAAYRQAIAAKRVAFTGAGLDHVPELNPAMFPHQAAVTEFALRTGRSAMFLDTGLGKSLCGLDWGRVIVEHTNRPVLMLAPLAVSGQHQREAEKFGIDAKAIRDPDQIGGARVYITNYERLDRFDPDAFGGVILDESSILKGMNGKTTRALIAAFSRTQFRLCCTATPAPNDHAELGQHSEFLGVLSSTQMLTRWFIHDSADTGTWRMKGHAVTDFWNWVASWARCVSTPSDLGFSDDGFVLPPMQMNRHVVKADRSIGAGQEKGGQSLLFRIPDTSATAIHKEKRMTAPHRAKLAADIVFADLTRCLGSRNTPNGESSGPLPILSIERNATIRPSQRMLTSVAPTCATTTPGTGTASQSSDERRPQNETLGAESDTPRTRASERAAKPRRARDANTCGEMQGSAPNTASTPTDTKPCSRTKVAGAPSAGFPKEASAGNVSRSITATSAVGLEGCSAPTATVASASLTTGQNGSEGPPSISTDESPWWVVWCDADYEQDELEHLFGDAAISIRGSMTANQKEELHDAWLRGERYVLICKPVMFGYGLNWQHCHKMFFVGLSFSYESFYQAVRRCYRFGQARDVQVHVACADTEESIWQVVSRKAGDHDAMKREMALAMKRAALIVPESRPYAPTQPVQLPAWVSA